jgi:hypothetical protein
MIGTATDTPEINHNSDDQNDQIEAGRRLPGIRHPRISQCRQGQDQESNKGQKESMICALQIVGEKEQQQKRNAWEGHK